MGIFRLSIVFLCDKLLKLIVKLRKSCARRKGDLLPPFTSTNGFWAYDVVMTKKDYNRFVIKGGTYETVQWGDIYSLGVIVGFYYPDSEYVKVVKVNTAELDKPVVVKYRAEDLVIVESPINNLRQAAMIEAALSSVDFESGEDQAYVSLDQEKEAVVVEDGNSDDEDENNGGGWVH